MSEPEVFFDECGSGSECETCGVSWDFVVAESRDGVFMVRAGFGCYGGSEETYETREEALAAATNEANVLFGTEGGPAHNGWRPYEER